MPVALPDIAPARVVTDVYERLHAAYGDRHWHWYPEHVRGPFDVIAGAVLVQHTTWTNAERALEALRAVGMLDPTAIRGVDESRLVELVRVSGTPTVKAKRLRAVAQMLLDAGGLNRFLELPDAEMRARLLATHGIGEESADAILLYAAGRTSFVIDAYTRRLFARLGYGPHATAPYGQWRRYFEHALPSDAALFGRYHAYIVLHGKALCRPRPLCAACPLLRICATGAAAIEGS